MADEKQQQKQSGQRQARDADKDREAQMDRREFSDEERPSESAPLATSRPKMQDPGPDVSNADIDLNQVSLDTGHSTHVENPDPNPNELRPAPGPSTIEVLGKPDGDPVENRFEATRGGGGAS